MATLQEITDSLKELSTGELDVLWRNAHNEWHARYVAAAVDEAAEAEAVDAA